MSQCQLRVPTHLFPRGWAPSWDLRKSALLRGTRTQKGGTFLVNMGESHKSVTVAQ